MDLVQAQRLRDQRQRARAPMGETGIAQGAPVDGWVQVNCSGVVESAICLLDVTPPAAGDVVLIMRVAAPVVLGILSRNTSPDPSLGPQAPPDPAQSGITYLPALQSWTWESDGTDRQFNSRSDLSQGTSWPGAWTTRRGWWYWGWSVRSALADATVDAARIHVTHRTAGTVSLVRGDGNTIWPANLAADGVPAEPVVGATLATVADDGWVDLPVTLAQAMVDATPPSLPPTVGVVGSDDVTLVGVQSDPSSGLLEITWHR